MASESPEGLIKRIAENGLGIRFGRGVVGKTSHVMIVLIVIWGIVVWRLGSDLMMNCFLIGAATIATAIAVWFTRSTQAFAERNPAQAMLDGAEFLEYQKVEAEIKGGPTNTRHLAAGNAPLLPPEGRG